MVQPPALKERIQAFSELGKIMGKAADSLNQPDPDFRIESPTIYDAIHTAGFHNAWFIPANIEFALRSWQKALRKEALESWIEKYKDKLHSNAPKKVAVIMAGNIPLVGFHDFLCTLISGHHFIGKLSSDDKILLPALAETLCSIEPGFLGMIHFIEHTVKDFDAIIATGSNNTSRYFEYYFSKYPHIIRKNRNGVAVITGNEGDETLIRLGDDICSYFGLGCRNVSKIFIPENYNPVRLFTAIEPYIGQLNNHNKYMNNYSYYRSIYLLNSVTHLDNGVFLLTESEQYSSPIPVVSYQFYNNIDSLSEKLLNDNEYIQCIASESFKSDNTVEFGKTQSPDLGDYADGIDTMKFLTEL